MTRDELFSRNAAITLKFAAAGRTTPKGAMLRIQIPNDEGMYNWDNRLVASVLSETLNDIKVKNRVNFVAYGEDAILSAIANNNQRLADQIKVRTTQIDSVVEKRLNERYGHLIELQKEYDQNWITINSLNMDVEDQNNGDLDKIDVSDI